jgi:hypothetical protein
MSKQIQDPHRCELCAPCTIVLSVNNRTEEQSLQWWKDFALPASLIALESDHRLETHLRSQLKAMNPFLITSPKQVHSHAANGCDLFAYIQQKILAPLDILRSGRSSVESSDEYKSMHGQKYERSTHNEISRHESVDIEERLFIGVEPLPGKSTSSRWRFRWYAEASRARQNVYKTLLTSDLLACSRTGPSIGCTSRQVRKSRMPI